MLQDVEVPVTESKKRRGNLRSSSNKTEQPTKTTNIAEDENPDNEVVEEDDEEVDEGEESRGNTPVKVKSPKKLESARNDNWRERVVSKISSPPATVSEPFSASITTTIPTQSKQQQQLLLQFQQQTLQQQLI